MKKELKEAIKGNLPDARKALEAHAKEQGQKAGWSPSTIALVTVGIGIAISIATALLSSCSMLPQDGMNISTPHVTITVAPKGQRK